MSFHVGQKVVCVDKARAEMKARFPGSNYPQKGGIYTIRQINVWSDRTLLMLHELDNRHFIGRPIEGICYGIEPGFDAKHFRPIVENKSSISFTMGADPESERWDNRKKVKERT